MSTILDDLELPQGPVRHIGDALASGLFDGGTLDTFVNDEHYRIAHLRYTLRGEHLSIDRRCKAKRYSSGSRLPAPKFTMNEHFYGQAAVMMTHANERVNGKRKLKFISLAQKTGDGRVIGQILYRSGVTPNRNDFQIIGWRDSVNPMIGGAAFKSSKN